MNKLMSYLLPGFLVVAVLSLAKSFFLSPDVATAGWFVTFYFVACVVAVIIPALVYFLRTPPGISHK
ncbi:MAG: hypothetical protein MJY99_08480 [Fibrobacter sp.]|nr:hypothetical protein [Fibrobacter sp.]